MLVLSRKLHDRIQINDEIILEVVAIGHNRVKFAISAPADVSINRQELLVSSASRISSGDPTSRQMEFSSH